MFAISSFLLKTVHSEAAPISVIRLYAIITEPALLDPLDGANPKPPCLTPTLPPPTAQPRLVRCPTALVKQ
jgi:hypothetical protein